MKYLEDDVNSGDANYCVSVYELKTNSLVRNFYFKLGKNDVPAYAVRYVCNNFPMYIDDYVYIKMFKVKRGFKVGVC